MYQSSIIGVALLIEDQEKILVGQRSDNRDFAPNLWELPAGRVEEGESLENAIKREAMEELGITIISHQIVDAYQFLRNSIPMILLTYACRFEGEITQSNEHQNLKWVTPKEAIDLFQFELQKGTIQKYIQLR